MTFLVKISLKTMKKWRKTAKNAPKTAKNAPKTAENAPKTGKNRANVLRKSIIPHDTAQKKDRFSRKNRPF